MPINLLYLTFTEQDDIVPESGEAQILSSNNSYFGVNTLAGNDRITGISIGNNYSDILGYGFKNEGVLNTDDGDDVITGITLENSSLYNNYGFVNVDTLNMGRGNDVIIGSGYFIRYGSYKSIYNSGTINTGEGDDRISGWIDGEYCLVNEGTLNMEDGNDIITASGRDFGLINDRATLNTGEGNDTITARGGWSAIRNQTGSTINTGNGEDSIISEGTFYNETGSTINTGNGEDSIISQGTFSNGAGVFLGNGNDLITSTNYSERALENNNFIGTGNGDDIITSYGFIDNFGIINTGNGHDSIIVEGGGFDYNTGNYYSIYNNGGSINTGDGNDSIITNAGFASGENSSGAWFLGEGEDYIKGFGSGDFYGGNGNDTLELTPGTYVVGRWGEGGQSPIFTKGNQLMITSQFETLIAGGITYNFASLTAGQIITVPEV